MLVSPRRCVWMFRHWDMARFSSLLGPLPITVPALVRFMIPSGSHWHLGCQLSGLISFWGLACWLNECVFSTFWVLLWGREKSELFSLTSSQEFLAGFIYSEARTNHSNPDFQEVEAYLEGTLVGVLLRPSVNRQK